MFIDSSQQIDPSFKQRTANNLYDAISYDETSSVEKPFKDTSLVEISQSNQDSNVTAQSNDVGSIKTKPAGDGKADYYQLSPNHNKESEGMRLYFSMHAKNDFACNHGCLLIL